MLKVTVELVPGGDSSWGRVIGDVRIGNISELAEVSDYAWAFAPDGDIVPTKSGTIHGHVRADGFPALLARVFSAIDKSNQ
jgi:hypothetical protein